MKGQAICDELCRVFQLAGIRLNHLGYDSKINKVEIVYQGREPIYLELHDRNPELMVESIVKEVLR